MEVPRVPNNQRNRSWLTTIWPDGRWRWWHIVLLPISLPLALAYSMLVMGFLVCVGIILGIVSIPFIPGLLSERRAREKEELELHKTIQAAGRIISWETLEPRIR